MSPDARSGAAGKVREVGRSLLPYGFVSSVQRRRAAVEAQEREQAELADRTARLRAAELQLEQGQPLDWDYEVAIRFLCDRGLAEEEVRDGSMPEASLDLCGAAVRRELDSARPLSGLHVGNFVGVSLGAFAALARDCHQESVVVAVDPDVSHRGIERPALHAMQLLRHFGLRAQVLPVTAFSLHQNLGNDGFDRYDQDTDPWKDLVGAAASEEALGNLRTLAEGRFDFAVLDGNHEAAYLERELGHVHALLRPGGLLILDDVAEGVWSEIAQTFENLFRSERPMFERVEADGRVGLARKAAEPGG